MISTPMIQPSQATASTLRPISLVGPQGDVPFYGWLKSSIIPVIFGMKSANFTSGNVLYAEFTTNDQYTQFLPISHDVSSLTVNLTSFKTNLQIYLSTHTGSTTLNTLLSQVLSEIGSNTQLNINKTTNFVPTKIVDQLSHYVVILYDPDKSVINALDTIRSNQTLTTQPFTGDEVLTTVRMDRIVESIYGKFYSRNSFSYNNGTLATKLIELGTYLNFHPLQAYYLMNTLNITNELAMIRNFNSANSVYNQTINQIRPLKNVNLGFDVSQMQINNLTFAKRGSNVILKDFNATLVESNSLGVTIYNDTNNNGIMDMNMRTVSSSIPGINNTVLPHGSDEALYRVDFKNATSSTYVPVAKNTSSNELTFSFNAQNVGVDLNPVSKNLDNSLLNNASLSQYISNFGLTFHFTVNSTDNSANVKFDYNLGDWSNQTMLQGLSLNQMFLTGVSDYSGHQRVMRLNYGNNSAVNDNGASYQARKFLITAGQSPIASVTLDQQPYIWNGTTSEQANGQTLPLLFANYLFGSMTSYSNIIKTSGGSVSSAKYLYSLSYPVFGGYSINHDPTFSMVASTSSNTTSISKTGVPGFEFISLILALPVILLAKKKIHLK